MKRFTMIVLVLLTLVLQTSYAQEFYGINHVNRLYNSWQNEYDGSSTGDTLYIACGDNVRGRVVVTMFDCHDPDNIHEFNSFPLHELYYLSMNSRDNLVFIGHSSGMRIFSLDPDGSCYILGNFDHNCGITAIELFGQNAFLGTEDGRFIVLNLEDPQNPHLISTVDLGFAPTQIKGSGSSAYVTGERFVILNIVNPENPEITSTLNRNGLDLEIIGEIACIAIGDDGIRFYNVSDPEDPFETGHIRNSSQHLEQLDGRLVTGYHMVRFEKDILSPFCSLIDISNPFVPEIVTAEGECHGDLFSTVGDYIAQFTVGRYIRPSGITFRSFGENGHLNENGFLLRPQNTYFVSGRGHFLFAIYGKDDDKTLVILEASNPERPTELSRFNLGNLHHYNFHLGSEGKLFYENRERTIRSIDVSNPLEPIHTDFTFEPPFYLRNHSISTYMNNLIIPTSGGEESGIFIVSTDLNNPEETFFELEAEVRMEPAIVDDYMYVPAMGDGVIILQVSEIMHPREIGRFDVQGEARYLDVEDDLLCVSDGNLNIFNIEDRENPELLSVFDVPDTTYRVDIKNGYAYMVLASPRGGSLPYIHIVDLNDPDNPIDVGHGVTYYVPRNLYLNPPYIYTAEGNGLGIYECSEVVGVSPDNEGFAPQTSILYPAYPNPFNSFTSLKYNLTKPATVQIGIYDSQGRQVLDVANHQLKYPGIHTAIINANSLPSGSYLALLKAGDLQEVAPLILVK